MVAALFGLQDVGVVFEVEALGQELAAGGDLWLVGPGARACDDLAVAQQVAGDLVDVLGLVPFLVPAPFAVGPVGAGVVAVLLVGAAEEILAALLAYGVGLVVEIAHGSGVFSFSFLVLIGGNLLVVQWFIRCINV